LVLLLFPTLALAAQQCLISSAPARAPSVFFNPSPVPLKCWDPTGPSLCTVKPKLPLRGHLLSSNRPFLFSRFPRGSFSLTVGHFARDRLNLSPRVPVSNSPPLNTCGYTYRPLMFFGESSNLPTDCPPFSGSSPKAMLPSNWE